MPSGRRNRAQPAGEALQRSDTSATVAQHFAAKPPAVRQLYDQLLKQLRPFGPFTEVPNQGSIHLRRSTVFAGVATRKDHLLVSFKSDQPQPSPRVHKTEQGSARRYYHYVKIASAAELDAELLGWLKAAYALSG